MEQKLKDAFVRIKAGEWLCRAPVSIHGPGGEIPVTPGVVYRTGRPVGRFDVAELLDTWHATGRVPPNIRVV